MYSAPVLRYDKTTNPALFDWNGESSELHVTLPIVTYPLSIVFAIGTSIPETDKKRTFGFGLGFGFSLGEREKSMESEESSDTESSEDTGTMASII